MSAVEGRVAMKSAVHDDPGIFDPGNGVEKTSPQGTCFFQNWKNKSPGDLFFPDFSRSGKNKSPGDLFLAVLEKQVPRGLVFPGLEKQDFT